MRNHKIFRPSIHTSINQGRKSGFFSEPRVPDTTVPVSLLTLNDNEAHSSLKSPVRGCDDGLVATEVENNNDRVFKGRRQQKK